MFIKVVEIKRKIHTEEISYRAFKINKDLFSWKLKKFNNYPDITQVYKTLTHLNEEKKSLWKQK